MRFVLTRDPDELAARADRFLAERLERNVLATVLMNVCGGAHRGAASLFAYGLDENGAVRYAALRTPPWFLLSSELDPAATGELMDLWLAEDPEVPGVDGVPQTARALAAAWSERTGGRTRCKMSEALHVLEEVDDPPFAATGRVRLADDEDRSLLTAWMEAFAREAGVVGAERARAMVDARLASEGLLVWDDGEPVSMAGTAPPVAGVVRVGPVYTPPERRRRGYGGSLVAAASRRALGRGATRCMLFTDLANPTSNKIYAEVGYRRCGEWEEHAFEVS